MTATGWATLLSAAVGYALSPVALLELILVLFSKRRTVNALVFVTAVVTLTGVGIALGFAGQQAAGGGDDGEATSTGMAIVLLLLGLVLVAAGVKNWRNRADRSEPAMLATIANMGPGAVAFLSLGATLLNPKNLVLLLAAGQAIAAGNDGIEALLVSLLFVAVATLPYTGAVACALLGGADAHRRLDQLRTWLIAHNRAIMGVVCGLLGLLLAAKGVAALA